jgi:ubiquinone/menaquinone biosynthesis C-methylase UbiE
MNMNDSSHPERGREHHLCPWWLGYLLANPVRRLVESPERLLAPYVQPGMTVVEPGCGMGFFTLPLARLVGPGGRVVCADLQPKMIAGLKRRAARAGLAGRIVTVVCSSDDLGLGQWNGSADLAVAIHMVHEVPDQEHLLRQLHATLRPGGLLLVIEPKGHVSQDDFARSLAAGERAGFTRTDRVGSGRKLEAALAKRAG